ncbi:MAG: cupin domain-containing protein [Microgenomates group bacterium]
MKILYRNQAKEYSNSPNCNGFEFDLGVKDIDGAVVNVTGRYPEKGHVVNKVCREIAYIIEGNGQVVIEGKSFDVKSEDLIVIDKGEQFSWEGNLRLFIYCTPAWSHEQHKQVS